MNTSYFKYIKLNLFLFAAITFTFAQAAETVLSETDISAIELVIEDYVKANYLPYGFCKSTTVKKIQFKIHPKDDDMEESDSAVMGRIEYRCTGEPYWQNGESCIVKKESQLWYVEYCDI